MKVILVAATSLNGKIAQAVDQNSLEWTSKEDTAFFVEKTKEAGVVIMGQKTFATIGKPLRGRRLIVLTKDETMKEGYPVPQESDTKLEFLNESPTALIHRLENEGVSSVVIGGGAYVYSSFLREGLITDIFLTIEPILFGEGIPLAESFGDIKLRFVESKELGEQSIMLHYEVV